MRVIVLWLCIASACGSKRAPARDEAGPIDPPASEPAAVEPAPVEPIPMDPEVARLAERLEAVEPKDLDTWLERRKYRPDDAGPLETPEAIQDAIAALVAWDAANRGLPMTCASRNHPAPGGPLPMWKLPALTRAVLALATRADEPQVRALLHAGHALRDPANESIAILLGVSIAKQAARWLVDNKLQPSTAFTTYALSTDTALHAVRSDLRCAAHTALEIRTTADFVKDGGDRAIEELARMRRSLGMEMPDDWVAAELAEFRKWFRAMLPRLDAATNATQLVELGDELARSAATHPSSVFVRVVGKLVFSPRLAKHVQETTEAAREYRDALAGP